MRKPPFPRLLGAFVLLVVALAATGVASAQATSTPHVSYRNPVAGHPWGVNTGTEDNLWTTFEHSTGAEHALLAKIALRPRTRWYSSYITTAKIGPKIRADVAQEQNGNKNVQVWMALFRLWPHYESALHEPMTSSEISSYKAWMTHAARAIGNTDAAIVLEPDMPVALGGWRPAVRLGLVRWAAKLLSSLPNTTVYLDAGASDWLSVPDATNMLLKAGVAFVHGFALDITHHNSTADEVAFGGQIVNALKRRGLAQKHFVVDTSDNGHPYSNKQYKEAHNDGNPENVMACTAQVTRACVSLGIPPTTDVTNPKWKLPASEHAVLANDVDAFMWLRLAWMSDNDKQFSLPYALNIVRSSPWN